MAIPVYLKGIKKGRRASLRLEQTFSHYISFGVRATACAGCFLFIYALVMLCLSSMPSTFFHTLGPASSTPHMRKHIVGTLKPIIAKGYAFASLRPLPAFTQLNRLCLKLAQAHPGHHQAQLCQGLCRVQAEDQRGCPRRQRQPPLQRLPLQQQRQHGVHRRQRRRQHRCACMLLAHICLHKSP